MSFVKENLPLCYIKRLYMCELQDERAKLKAADFGSQIDLFTERGVSEKIQKKVFAPTSFDRFCTGIWAGTDGYWFVSWDQSILYARKHTGQDL
jgi:hypothetical protein